MDVIVEAQSPTYEINSPERKGKKKVKEESPVGGENADELEESILVRKLKRYPRSHDDAKFIYEEIRQYTFFQNFVTNMRGSSEEKALLQICKSVTYEKIPKGKYVFKEGDPSNNKFYVILSGRISIIFRKDTNMFIEENKKEMKRQSLRLQLAQRPSLIAISKEEETKSMTNIPGIEPQDEVSNQLEATRPKASSKFSRRFTEMGDNLATVVKQPGLKILKNVKSNPTTDPSEILGFKRNELKHGEAFGEKAIMASNPSLAKRTASAYAETDCEFIIIHRQDFLSIIGRFDKEKEFKNAFLFKNIPAISRVASSSTVENLLYSFKELYLGKNKFVTKEGTAGTEVFYLVEGSCTVKRSFDNSKSGVLGRKAEYVISTIGENNLIGGEILFEQVGDGDSAQYKYTIEVITNRAKFFSISADYLKTKFPAEAVAYLKSTHIKKEEVRDPIFNKFTEKIRSEDTRDSKNTKKLYETIKNRELAELMTEKLKSSMASKVKENSVDALHTEESLENHLELKMNEFKKNILDRSTKKKLIMEKLRNKVSTKNTDVRFLFKYFEEKQRKESPDKRHPHGKTGEPQKSSDIDEANKLLDVSLRDLNIEDLEREGIDRFIRFAAEKQKELPCLFHDPIPFNDSGLRDNSMIDLGRLKKFDFGKDEGTDRVEILKRKLALPKVAYQRFDRSLNLSEKFFKRKDKYITKKDKSWQELSISSFCHAGARMQTNVSGNLASEDLNEHGRLSNNNSRVFLSEGKCPERLRPLGLANPLDAEIKDFLLEGESRFKSPTKGMQKQWSEASRSQMGSRANSSEPFNLNNFLKIRHKRNTSLASMTRSKREGNLSEEILKTLESRNF